MNKLYKEEDIQAIGNAIRTKGGTSTLLKVEDMAQAIADIPEPTGTEEIDENGTYNISSKKYVAVNVPQTGIEPQGTFPITQNGTYNIRQYERVDVAVEGGKIKVNPTYRDTIIIPDRYNTGLSAPELCTETLSDTDTEIEGIPLRHWASNEFKIDWNAYGVKTLTGTYTIENYDFTTGASIGYTNGTAYSGDGIVIIFKNCKFNTAPFGGGTNEKRTTKFINCQINGTLVMDYGEATKCHIVSDQGNDGVQAYGNALIKECYIEVIDTPSETQGSNHMDGFQDWLGDNIYLDNVRIDMPSINYTHHKGAINDTFFMEVNAEHCGAHDCLFSGGGVYLMACYTDCVIDSCILQRDAFYPGTGRKKLSDCINTVVTDKLAVSSVINDNSTIIINAINYTHEDKVLTVKTNKGVTTFNISKYYNTNDYEVDTKSYADYPLNVECEIDAEGVDYVICYDDTTQIRFVNYTNHDIYIGGANIEPLTITENGTYTATDIDGYSPVTVNVAGGVFTKEAKGTFTITEETEAEGYTITHNLGVIPDVFLLYSQGTMPSTTTNKIHSDMVVNGSESATVYQRWSNVNRIASGSVVTDTTYTMHTDILLSPAVTYKWIAIKY